MSGFTPYTYTTNNTGSDSIAIGYNATANTSDCIAIGSGATCTGANASVVIGAGASVIGSPFEFLHVGDSVRFDFDGRPYTGEITEVVDGYTYRILSDSPLPPSTSGQDVVTRSHWQVEPIDPLQRFTEAVNG